MDDFENIFKLFQEADKAHRKLKYALEQLCPHKQIKASDEHYYCELCNRYVGDVYNFFGDGHPLDVHPTYIPPDDPRIVDTGK